MKEMKLNLERPLVFFDIESTGLNIASDSIIELCFVKVMPDGEERVKTWRVKPWDYELQCQREINPSAEAVHGISAEDLKDSSYLLVSADDRIELSLRRPLVEIDGKPAEVFKSVFCHIFRSF